MRAPQEEEEEEGVPAGQTGRACCSCSKAPTCYLRYCFRLVAGQHVLGIYVHHSLYTPQDHLTCGLGVCLTSRRSAFQIQVFQNLGYELTAGQVGTGSAWKLYIHVVQRPPWSSVPGLLRAGTREHRQALKVFYIIVSQPNEWPQLSWARKRDAWRLCLHACLCLCS